MRPFLRRSATVALAALMLLVLTLSGFYMTNGGAYAPNGQFFAPAQDAPCVPVSAGASDARFCVKGSVLRRDADADFFCTPVALVRFAYFVAAVLLAAGVVWRCIKDLFPRLIVLCRAHHAPPSFCLANL